MTKPASATLAHTFVSRGIWLYVFSLFILPAGFIIKLIITNDLSVHDVGIIYGAISLVTLLSIYGDLGIGEALQLYLPRFFAQDQLSEAKTLLCASLALRVISGCSIGALFYLGAGFLAEHHFRDVAATAVIQIYSLYFVFMSVNEVALHLTAAMLDTFWQKFIESARLLGALAGGVFLYTSDLGTPTAYAWTWVGGIVLASLVAIGLYFFRYRATFSDHRIVASSIAWREVLVYSASILLANNIGMLMHQIDMQALIRYADTVQAGYYATYQTIISLPFMVLGPILGMILPVVSDLLSRGEKHKIILIRSIFSQLFVMMAIVVSAWMWVFGPEIASFLFGQNFAPSGHILRSSVLMVAFLFLIQIDFWLLSGLGRARDRTKALLVGLVVNVALVALAIVAARYFAWMPAASVSLAVGLSWIALWIAARRLLGEYTFVYPWRSTLVVMLITCTTSLLALWYMRGSPADLSDRSSLAITLAIWALLIILPSVLYLFPQIRALWQQVKASRS